MLGLIPRWLWIYIIVFGVGFGAGGAAIHAVHKAWSNGQKALATRVLEKLDQKIDAATSVVETRHAETKADSKVKERIVYREVIKRVPQNDPPGCPPLDDDTVRLLNAARVARTAEEFVRLTTSVDDAEGGTSPDPAH